VPAFLGLLARRPDSGRFPARDLMAEPSAHR